MPRPLAYSMMDMERVSKTRLTFTYIRDNILDSNLWSDLHTNVAAERLTQAVRRYFSEYGGNIVEKVCGGFVATPELLAKLRASRKS